MPRDFDIFMSKHLAGQWILNSYFSLYYSFTESLAGLPIRSHIPAGGACYYYHRTLSISLPVYSVFGFRITSSGVPSSTIFPWCMTSTLSQNCWTSAMSWQINRYVIFLSVPLFLFLTVTVLYLHSYEPKCIKNHLRWWHFGLYVSGFWHIHVKTPRGTVATE